LQPILLENLCDFELQNQIKAEIKKDAQFFYTEATSGKPLFDIDDPNILESPQMVCPTVDKNEPSNEQAPLSFYLCDRIAERLDVKILNYARIKINLQFQNPIYKDKYNPPHLDSPFPNHISAVYYVEDSDGDTIIFDKGLPDDPYDLTPILRNPPKQGNALVFPSKQFHSSSLPVENSNRFIINFVLEVSENDYQKLFTKID